MLCVYKEGFTYAWMPPELRYAEFLATVLLSVSRYGEKSSFAE
jgi:hypothetical protein